MEDFDDDFGELYTNVELHPSSAINVSPEFNQLYIHSSSSSQQQQKQQFHDQRNVISDDSSDDEKLRKDSDDLGGDEVRANDLGTVNGGAGGGNGTDTEEEEDDDDDDDFVVVVNDEDFEAKIGGGSGGGGGVVERKVGDEVRENVKEVECKVSEAKSNGNGNDQGGCGGGGVRGGELGKFNGGNSQYKYVRQNGSVSLSNARGSRLMSVDKENFGHCQPRRSTMGRFGSTYTGSAEHGSNFWLPRYRTVLDVDIDSFEQKPWTYPGADVTDFFNFGLDEESWRSYCQSLDQLRQQTFPLTWNPENGNFISKPDFEAGAAEEPDFKEAAERGFSNDSHGRRSLPESYSAGSHCNWRVGQAIFVEDCSTERQPSMDVKPPRNCDSDVVIEITLQESENPSELLKELDDKLEAKYQTLEKGCQHGENVRETQISGDSKNYKKETTSSEKYGLSQSSSSDLKRSHRSATVSSHELKSGTLTEEKSSESGKLHPGMVDTFSGDPTAVATLSEGSYSDLNSTETNPCVAGIDLLSDGHLQGSSTSSYSDVHSEDPSDNDHCDSRTPRHSRRLSPDSVMERIQVAKNNHYRARVSKKDEVARKGYCHKSNSRVRSSMEANPKHCQKNSWGHSELKSHHQKDDDCGGGNLHHMRSGRRPRLHHGTRRERQHGSELLDDDWPGYRTTESSFPYYDRRSDECTRGSRQRDHCGSGDEINLYNRRGWGDDHSFPEGARRLRGDTYHGDWYFEGREGTFRKGEHLSKIQPFWSKHSSSIDMECQNRQRDYDDIHLNKRSKLNPRRVLRDSFQPAPDRFAESTLTCRQRECLDSDMEHQRRLRYVRREAVKSGRGDEFFDSPSVDWDYQPCTRDEVEYQSGHAFHSAHDKTEFHQLSERRSRYISDRKSPYDREFCDDWDAYDREDTSPYFDEDNYFERRHVFQSNLMDWEHDVLFESNFNNAFHDEGLTGLYDTFESIPRQKWHGAKHRFLSARKSTHTRGMKRQHGVISSGKYCDKSFKMPMKANHEHRLWCKNPAKLCNVRERKSGDFSRPGSVANPDASAHVDGRLQKHIQEQQRLVASSSEKAIVNKGLKVEESRDRVLATNYEGVPDLEEGQIPTERNNLKANKSECFVIKNNRKGSSFQDQKSMNCNGGPVYDESRILETIAKMEKRRERFKEPTALKLEKDSDPEHQANKLLQPAESKGQRPARKRQWVAS